MNHITGHGEPAMGQIYRDNRCLPDLKRTVDHRGINPEVVLPGLGFVKDEAESLPDPVHGGGGGIDRHLPILHLAKAPHVVETHDVVRVGMSEECRIQPADPLAQALGPKVRRGIDDEMTLLSPDQKRGPRTVIAWIPGDTDGTFTSDDGYPLGGSGTEKNEFQQRHL